MKGKYLVVIAVLVMSVLVLTVSGGSDDASAADPASYEDLDEATRVLIGSSYCDAMPLTEGGTDPSEMVKVRSDASGNNYIGYYEGNLYLVLDAPAWTQGQEDNLPSFSIVFQETTYEIRAVNLSADSSVTVLKMGGDSSGPTVEPIAGGLYVGSSSAPVITKSYCVLTSNDWLIYDTSLEKFIGSANIKKHVVTVDQPTTLEMGNGVYGTDFTGGAMTLSLTVDEVTYSAEMQPLIEGEPSSATGYKLSFVNITGYPLQFSHPDTSGTYSMRVHYTDTDGGDLTVQCDSVENYVQNIYFDASKPGELYLGSAANHDTALSVNNSDALTLVYGGSGDPYYRYTGAAGYDSYIIVATAPENETYHELRLLHGEVVLTQGTNMYVGGIVIGAVIGSVDLFVQEEEEVHLTVAPSDTFALDGRQYVAYSEGSEDLVYIPYNFAETSEELHGILLSSDQKIILGNGAMAVYEAQGNQATVERAIRNENPTSGTATTVNVENNTNPITVSTGDQNVILGSYLVVDTNLRLQEMCSVTTAPFAATVDNDTGEFNVTAGAKGDVIIKEAGEELSTSAGMTYTAVSRSVFTGSDPEYVLESGQVTITSDSTTSITIRRPDNSTLTIIGASQATAGETCTFLFPAGSISIGDSSYLAVTESQFTLDGSDILRMAYGRVTVPQGGSVTVPGTSYDMTFTAPADSDGTIQFATDPRRAVSIYSGVFEVSLSSGNNSCTIYLMAEGSGIAYDGATFTYADGQADLDIYGGTVRLTGSNQSVSFDGTIRTYQNSNTRSYSSVGGAATITLNEGASAVPALTAGTIQTEHLLIVNGVTLDTYPGATVDYEGTATIGPSKSITASATVNPPQGDPVTYTYTYTNNSGTDDLVLSFAFDSDIIATLESGSVSIASGTSVTVAGHQYTATTSNAVLTLDNGAMVLQSGIVSATSHVWNGVLIEAVDSTFRIDSSLNRITFNARTQLQFDGKAATYEFGIDNRLLVTSDGHVLLTDGNTMIPAGGSICFGTEAKYYIVENIDDEYVTVFSAFTVTGIGDGKSVRISSGDSNVTVTRNGGNNDVSVSIYPSDGSVYISQNTGYVMTANFVMTDMTFKNGDSTVAGTGTLSVESRDSGITAAYSSGTFDVNGPLLFDTITVSGEFSVAPNEAISVITVPVSKSVTVTPDGEEPTEYANASSADPLLIEYNSKTFAISPSSGEYYVKANTAVSVGGVCDVTLLSEESTDTMVVGVGSYNYVILSNGQQAGFSSMEDSTSFTYTAAANGTRFDVIGRPGDWNALLTSGAASFGSDGDRDTLSLTDYTSTLTYTSGSGAVIATHVADSALYAELVSGTATFPADGGTSLIVANTEFLAVGESATLTVSGTTPVLVDGGVKLNEGNTMLVGGVSITNVGDSDSDFYPSVDVLYDSTEGTRSVVFDREGITVSTHVIADYSFTSSSNCQVSVADDGRITASAGVFTLDDGESLTVGTVTVTSSGTSVISVDGEDFSVRSGSLTFSPAASFSVAGVGVSGAVSVTISDSITVYAPANGTIDFTATNTYSYTNASSSDVLVLEGNAEGGTFSPKSGSYYVYYGTPATVNGVTVSVGGQEGDSIVVDVTNNTVTLSNGNEVTFSNDTAVTYNAASDGTSFTVNSINDLPLISGSISLSRSQGILIGGTTYTAVSTPAVISSENGTAVLVSGSIAVPAGKSIKVGSNSFTAGDKQATVSASDGIATLVAETVILPAGSSIKIGDVTVLNNGTVSFEISAGGDAILPQNAKIRATLGSTSNDLTASSETQIRVESDGRITIISTSGLALAQGESIILGTLTVHADTASEISVNDGVVILLSGTVSLSTSSSDDPTQIRVSDIDISGASSASKGTSTYVVGPAAGTLVIDGKSYQNASQTQTIKFTYADAAFVLSEGSYSTTVSSNAPVNVNGYLIFSGSHNDPLDITVGPDTVAADSTVPIKIQKNEVSWTYDYPTGAVFTLGTDAVLTSGSVTVPESIILTIGTTVYTAENGEAVLSASNGKATLVSGEVAVPEGASVTVMGTEFTAYGGTGIIGRVSEGEGYVSITQSGFEIASADNLNVYLSEPGTLLKVGSSTFAYSDSTFGLSIAGTTVTLISIEPWVTFNGSITIGGVVYQSDGEASICYDGTSCSLSSGTVSFAGTSASPVSFTVGSNGISVDSDVKIGIGEDQGAAVTRIYSGSFTAGSEMQIAAGSSAFTVTQGVKVAYSGTATTFTVPSEGSVTYPGPQSGDGSNVTLRNNGSASIVFVYETMTLTMPAETGVRNGGETFTSGPEETVLVLGSPLTLKSGSVALGRGQSVVIGESTYSAVSTATIGVRSGNAVLIAGSVVIGGVEVSYNGSVDDYLIIPSDGRVTVAEGKSVSFVADASGEGYEYTAGTGGAVFLLSDSRAVFETGDILMSKGTYVDVGVTGKLRAYGETTEIARDSSGNVTLKIGGLEFPANLSVIVNGKTFRAVDDAATIDYGQSIKLTAGTVSVSGGFEVDVGELHLKVEGSDAVTKIAAGESSDDIPVVEIDAVNESVFTVSTSDTSYVYYVTKAAFGIDTAVATSSGDSGAAGGPVTETNVPKVMLYSGSANLAKDSVIFVEGLDMQFLRFDQAGDRNFILTMVNERPKVTLTSGSVNLTDAVDPTYENVGTGSLSFFANDSGNIELDSGTVSVPEGSTVKVGDRYITNDSGTVHVTADGVVVVQPNSSATVSSPDGASYPIVNDTSEPISRDVRQEEKEDGYTMYEAHRTALVDRVLESDANTQAVRLLMDQTVQSLNAAVYDASKSSSENIAALDEIYERFVDRYREIHRTDEQLFDDYYEEVRIQLENLHIGETSLTERYLIDNILSEFSNIEYNFNISLEENKAQVDAVLSEANSLLSSYRIADSSTFNVYKSVMLQYIETQPEGGLEEVGTLKTAYAESLGKLEYLSSQDKDRNLQRIDELIDGFDGAVLSAFIGSFNNQKATVIGNIVRLSASYSEPEALEYINSARNRLENYAYDQSVRYEDNINRINNLYTNLESNIGAAVLGNLNTYDDYCVKYHEKYVEVYNKYLEVDPGTGEPVYHPEIPVAMRQSILEAIAAARDKVDVNGEGRINYDHSLSLADNVNIIHKIASDLEDQIEYITSEDMRNELEKTYAAALDHFAKNDKPQTPTKILERIAEARDAVIAEYKSDHEVEVKGNTINSIMAEYDTDMAALIQRADFYFNIDRGCEFLQTKYETAQTAVVDRMAECVKELRAFEYRENLTLSENLALLQQKVNEFSLELTNLKATTNQGDFENYRDYVAWRVRGYTGVSPSVPDLVQTYSDKITALQYNGKSLYANKVAVDRLFQEFSDSYEKLEFEAYLDSLAANIEAMVGEGDQPSVRQAAADGASEIRNLRMKVGDHAGSVTEANDLFDLVTIRVGYAKAAYADNLDFFNERCNYIIGLTAHVPYINSEKITGGARMTSLRDSTELTQFQKAEQISAIDYRILDLMRFDAAYVEVTDSFVSMSSIDDSAKVRALAERYSPLINGYVYDVSLGVDGNIDALRTVLEEYSAACLDQKYAENSAVTGGIRADGKAMDGTEADYPEGVKEIWGSVANLNGLDSGVSVTMNRTGSANLSGGSVLPAEGSGFAVLGNGDVLGAFEVTLFKDGEKINDFSGTYRVRILLPEDMRGYDRVQVAYVDEYGDVQVYDAKVVGNYLEFYTTHFSAFSLIGLRDIPTYYDIYVYIAIAVIVLALAIYFVRVVRFDANGGTGRTPGLIFFGDGQGPMASNGFVREGYRFRGWSRTRDGDAEYMDCSDLSALGKIHMVKLYAVWEEVRSDA